MPPSTKDGGQLPWRRGAELRDRPFPLAPRPMYTGIWTLNAQYPISMGFIHFDSLFAEFTEIIVCTETRAVFNLPRWVILIAWPHMILQKHSVRLLHFLVCSFCAKLPRGVGHAHWHLTQYLHLPWVVKQLRLGNWCPGPNALGPGTGCLLPTYAEKYPLACARHVTECAFPKAPSLVPCLATGFQSS